MARVRISTRKPLFFLHAYRASTKYGEPTLVPRLKTFAGSGLFIARVRHHEKQPGAPEYVALFYIVPAVSLRSRTCAAQTTTKTRRSFCRYSTEFVLLNINNFVVGIEEDNQGLVVACEAGIFRDRPGYARFICCFAHSLAHRRGFLCFAFCFAFYLYLCPIMYRRKIKAV